MISDQRRGSAKVGYDRQHVGQMSERQRGGAVVVVVVVVAPVVVAAGRRGIGIGGLQRRG